MYFRRSYVLILIEDEQNNLFGGYIENEVIIDKHIKDKSCYVFSLRKNGEYTMKRYLKNENGYSYGFLSALNKNTLIVFGESEDSKCNDIVLYKNLSGYCKQVCYNYNDEQFALTGKRCFNTKRIIVYQLQ